MTSPLFEAALAPCHESSTDTGILLRLRAWSAYALCANASSYFFSHTVSVPAFPPYAIYGRNLHPLPASLCHQHSPRLQDSMLSATARFDDLSSLDFLY